MIRLLIDMQGAQTDSRFRGIGRYVTSFVHAIIDSQDDIEVFLAVNGNLAEGAEYVRDRFRGASPKIKITEWFAPDQIAFDYWRRDCAELIKKHFFQSINPDFVLITSLFEGLPSLVSIDDFDPQIPSGVIVYDLIPATDPGRYLDHDPAYKEDYYRKLSMLPKASALFTISEYAKSEIVNVTELSNERVFNISAAVSEKLISSSAGTVGAPSELPPRLLDREFLMYAGGFEHRKNVEILVRSYALLDEEARELYPLVLAGKIEFGRKKELMELAREFGVKRNEVIFTEFLSDDSLMWLYRKCHLFIFPSLHEGFGLPVLEAMSLGAPVIASNSSSLPEIVALQSALFDPTDEVALAKKINRVLTDSNYRNDLLNNSADRSQYFSWSISAGKALQVISRLVENFRDPNGSPANFDFFKLCNDIASIDIAPPSEEDLLETSFQIERTFHDHIIF